MICNVKKPFYQIINWLLDFLIFFSSKALNTQVIEKKGIFISPNYFEYPDQVLKFPIQKDENGKAVVYINPLVFRPYIRFLADELIPKPTPASTSPSNRVIAKEHTTFVKPNPKPEQIFNNARQYILYQDTALKALSTIFYYHLEAIQKTPHESVAVYLQEKQASVLPPKNSSNKTQTLS